MRVESHRPSKNAMGGWLHPLDPNYRPTRLAVRYNPTPTPTINATQIMGGYAEHTHQEWIDDYAAELGVTSESLMCLGAAWASDHKAWAFPMRDGYGSIVGIRLRTKDGKKFAVTGSRQGIFLPCCSVQRTAYICEGPTDTAAALSIGLFAIGRPSCSGGTAEIATCMHRLDIRRLVIVADNDKPGLDGAARLAQAVQRPSCTLVLPVKDMRDFVREGGDVCTLSAILKTMVWTMPTQEGDSIQIHTPRRLN